MLRTEAFDASARRGTAPAGAASGETARDDAFDAVKGVLVCLMVVYHVMNAATSAPDEAYRYLRFVSGSFIFVTGMIVARYASLAFAADARAAARKLIERGFKLVLLFTVLNLAIHASGFGNADKRQLGVGGFVEHAVAIYAGTGSGVASFAVLLPIGYLLIAAPLFLRVAGPTRRFATVVVSGATLAGAAVIGDAYGSLVLEFMLVGIAGLCLGSMTWARVQRTDADFALAPAVLLIAWFATAHVGFNLALHILGVALVIASMHRCARRVRHGGAAWRALVLLGRYSLAAYIVQIVLIQLGARALGTPRWPLADPAPLVFIMVTTASLVLGCIALESARRSFPWLDRAYRGVFA